MLKVWNVLLVILAFCLSLFGTFLTRSGVVNSIHSFTQSSIGPWFLGFIVRVGLLGRADPVLGCRSCARKTRLESLVSREATFLYNNLLLVALAPDDPLGRRLPARLRGGARRVADRRARPYYDFFLRVFGLPLLLLMGIGPLIAWRRASLRCARRGRSPGRPALARRRRRRAARARRRLVDPGPDRLHVLRLRARVDRARVRRAARARARRSRAARGPAPSRRWSRATAAATAATSSTRPSSCSRSASPARAPTSTVVERQARARAVARGRRLHAHLPLARARREARERDRDPSAVDVAATATSARDASRPGKNALPRRAAGLERGRRSARDSLTGEDLFVIAEQINPDGTRLLPGLRQAAREPDLARRPRLPPRLGDHALARRARGAPPGAALRASAGAGARVGDRRARPRARCSPSRASSLVALPFLREPERAARRARRARTRSSSGGWSSPRRATGRSARSRSSSSTTAPARSRTRTTAPSSGRCAARPPRRSGRSSRGPRRLRV